jgi:hypothetical protein
MSGVTIRSFSAALKARLAKENPAALRHVGLSEEEIFRDDVEALGAR